MKKNPFGSITIFVLQFLAIILIWNYLISPVTIVQKVIDVMPEAIKVEKVMEIEILKYELFRDLMMALVAFLAVVGPGLYFVLKRSVEEGVANIVEETGNLIELKQNLYWCNQREKEKEIEIKNLLQRSSVAVDYRDDIFVWLNELIVRARKALSLAEQLSKVKYDEGICRAKNNLAYYLAVRRSQSDKEEAKELALEVYKKSKNISNSWYNFFDTYVWVFWCFGDNNEEKEKARQIFSELYSRKDSIPDVRFKQKLEEYRIFFFGHDGDGESSIVG